MRNSKLLNKSRCVMIRVDSFVVATSRNDSYASVCRSSLIVNQSLKFAFIRRIQLATILSYSLHFVQVRKLSQRFVMGSFSIA